MAVPATRTGDTTLAVAPRASTTWTGTAASTGTAPAGPVARVGGVSALTGALEALREAADAVCAADTAALDVSVAAAAEDVLRGVGDRLAVVRARLLARIEDDGRWSASGSARTFPEWVARRGGASVGSARRDVALGRALEREVPAARRAVESGAISLEHARVLSEVAATSDARRAALASDRPDRNEAHLLDAARRLGVDDFRRLVRRWAAAVDTAAHEAEHRAAIEREHLRLVRRRDGVDVVGFLAGENAETLATALRTVSGVPAADDPRRREQRDAAALTALARAVLDHGLGGGGTALVRPHLLVHVPWETYEALASGVSADGGPAALPTSLETSDGRLGRPAELDDGTPIPASVLARLACDSRIRRIVFGPLGQPLDVGRARRTFTGPQRDAVVARDRTCRYPGCSAPPILCEVHHVVWWSRDGVTSVENGILLCAYHHGLVHRRDLLITWAPGGGFEFRRRDGTAVGGPIGLGPPTEAPPGRGLGREPSDGSRHPGGAAGASGDGAGAVQASLELEACA